MPETEPYNSCYIRESIQRRRKGKTALYGDFTGDGKLNGI